MPSRARKRMVTIKEGWQTEALEEGDVVTAIDRTFVWSPYHLKNSELDPWRQLSDTLADRALAALPTLASTTTSDSASPFEQIRHHVATTDSKGRNRDIQAFWDDVTTVSSLDNESYIPKDLIKEGQRVYVKYAGPIGLALLHYSLAGGFSSPRITRVLELTSYLVPRQNNASLGCPLSAQATSEDDKAVYDRLLETAQWVLDCMDGLDSIMPPPASSVEGGRGWEGTIRVRLLHAQMRAKVLRLAAMHSSTEGTSTSTEDWRHPGYSVQNDGVPLNQEDMAATLAAFGVAPIWSLERMGFRVSAREKEAYLALWRHLGLYLGIAPSILSAHFSSWERADALLLSTVLHLFAFPKSPETLARLPTVPVLRAVAARSFMQSSVGYHLALTRALLGDGFADDIGIPRSSLFARLQIWFSFLSMRLPVRFGELYPRKEWERRRQECIRRALPRIVVRGLGARRTTFTLGKGKWVKVDVEGEEWLQEGRRITTMWKSMWREMGLVVSGIVIVLGAGAYTAWLNTVS